MDHCGKDMDEGGSCSYVKLKDTWENSIPASRFCFKPNRKGKSGNSNILFSWAPKSLQMVTAAMKLKDTCSLKGKL